MHILSTMEMHTLGTGQCMITHDDTMVDLIVVALVVVHITLFTVNYKSTSLMMRAHTEGQFCITYS